MRSAGTFITVVALLGGVLGEAPYAYQKPLQQGITFDTPVNTINAVNNINGVNAVPGYVSPSLLVASTPPTIVNQQYASNYQEPDVHKHVYVHVAPDEPVLEQQSRLVVPPHKPKKHYKIVFIKAPTVLPPAASYVSLPQPDQEKTIIYVLSKKPDLQQSLVFSTPSPTIPSKPEVFFIRYKTTKEQQTLAQGLQQGLQNLQNLQNVQAVQNVQNVQGLQGVQRAQSMLQAGLVPSKVLSNSYGVPLSQPLGPGSAPALAPVSYNTV